VIINPIDEMSQADPAAQTLLWFVGTVTRQAASFSRL
jgi:hypothetical protein